jgi:hypothetical protein
MQRRAVVGKEIQTMLGSVPRHTSEPTYFHLRFILLSAISEVLLPRDCDAHQACHEYARYNGIWGHRHYDDLVILVSLLKRYSPTPICVFSPKWGWIGKSRLITHESRTEEHLSRPDSFSCVTSSLIFRGGSSLFFLFSKPSRSFGILATPRTKVPSKTPWQEIPWCTLGNG